MTKDELSLKPLIDAVKTLEEAVNKANPTQLERDGTIQRFEYTFEIAWKSLKRYFELNNKPKISNLKDIFREAGRQELISSVEDWFDFLKARNNTSHTYDPAVAEATYRAAVKFFPAVKDLTIKLEQALGGSH
jgi:nucleotidyltransferase substrate binding protein (TIGR01987 family)